MPLFRLLPGRPRGIFFSSSFFFGGILLLLVIGEVLNPRIIWHSLETGSVAGNALCLGIEKVDAVTGKKRETEVKVRSPSE